MQHSFDKGTPLPAWLRWLERRDASLRNYAAQAQELDDLLRVSASTRRKELASQPVSAVTNLTVQRDRPLQRVLAFQPLGWLAAAAAMLLVGTMLFNNYAERQTRAEHAKMISTQLAAMPDEMLGVFIQVARTSQEYAPLAKLNLPEVTVLNDIPRTTQGTLRESFSQWGLQLSAMGEQVYERFDVSAEMN
jgi:hypothetical protein